MNMPNLENLLYLGTCRKVWIKAPILKNLSCSFGDKEFCEMVLRESECLENFMCQQFLEKVNLKFFCKMKCLKYFEIIVDYQFEVIEMILKEFCDLKRGSIRLNLKAVCDDWQRIKSLCQQTNFNYFFMEAEAIALQKGNTILELVDL